MVRNNDESNDLEQWDEFFKTWENETSTSPTSETRNKDETNRKRIKLDSTLKSMVKVKQVGKPAGMMAMEHNWNEIPDDELYQMNAQGVNELDAVIHEFEETERKKSTVSEVSTFKIHL